MKDEIIFENKGIELLSHMRGIMSPNINKIG